MTRKQALLRRANKLLGWLHQDRFTVYEGEESLVNLRRLIEIIIDVVAGALENHPAADDRRCIIALMQDGRKILTVEEGEDQEAAYNETIQHLIFSLETYREFLEEMED